MVTKLKASISTKRYSAVTIYSMFIIYCLDSKWCSVSPSINFLRARHFPCWDLQRSHRKSISDGHVYEANPM